MFTIVNGIQIDLEDYIEDKNLAKQLEKDESFISAVSFGFEKEFASADDEIDGDEVLEMIIHKEVENRIEKMNEETNIIMGLVSKGLDANFIKVEVEEASMNEIKVSIGEHWFWTYVDYLDNQTLLDSVSKKELVKKITDTLIDMKENLSEDEYLYYKFYLEERQKQMNDGVREWYINKVPEDEEVAGKIPAELTFGDVLEALKKQENLYHVIGIADSFVREKVFEGLAERLSVGYNDIYNLWVDGASSNIKLWEDKSPKIVIEKSLDLDRKIANVKKNMPQIPLDEINAEIAAIAREETRKLNEAIKSR